jgi:DNA repair exonuclease SbcCD ATPase subunit
MYNTFDDFDDFGERIRDVKRSLERECECVMERAGWLKSLTEMADRMNNMVRAYEDLKERFEECEREKEEFRQRLEELAKTIQPKGSVAFYNYGTYNEVQGGGLSLVHKN